MDAGPRQVAELVDDAAGLERFFAALAQAGWVAIATEANAMHAYRPRVCLVQVAAGERLFAIDPLAFAAARPHPLAALSERLAPGTLVLVHGGEYTVAGLKRDLHLSLASPRLRLIDTQQAAVLLGLAETGYRSLCKALLGEILPPPVSVDWAERPLQAAHVARALDDVRFLAPLWSLLGERVVAADLVDELRLASLLVAETPPRANLPDPERWKQLPGASGLPPAALALLRVLVTWRDKKAKELDLPPGKLFPNAQLVALARRPDRAAGELERMRFHSRLVFDDREAVRRLVVMTIASPPSPPMPAPPPPPTLGAPPPPRSPRSSGPPGPVVKARIERLKRWRRDEAERRGVGLQAVLPGAALEHLAWFGAASIEVLLAMPWLGPRRVERYATVILALITEL